MPKMEEIYKLMEDHKLFGEVVVATDKRIGIEIQWGDWKHDHAYLDYIMAETFPGVKVQTEVTEEDGSDCYSAIHYYDFK